MKFGKQIQQQSVQSWQEYYMSYKRLKRVIKKLVLQIKQKDEQLLQSPNSDANERTHLLLTGDGRKEFTAVLENDIDKVNTFFMNKLDELYIQYNSLNDSNSNGTQNSTISTDKSNDAFNARHSSYTSIDIESPRHNTTSHSNAESTDNSHDSQTSHKSSRSNTLNTIGTLGSKQLSDKCTRTLELYRSCLQLKQFSDVNYTGFGKILKKYDKNTNSDTRDTILARLDKLQFRSLRDSELSRVIELTEELYTKYSIGLDKDIISILQILNSIKKDVDNPQPDESDSAHVKPLFIILAIACGIVASLLPVLPKHEPRAESCLGLLTYVTIMWVTEAVPFFVTSLTIPFLVVVSGILTDADGCVLSADKASKAAFGSMFNDTVMLILGGFAISTAFSKCQFELRIAGMIQKQFGSQPKIFLLSFMLLGCMLSMWISNVAAPVLLTTLILPIIRDFGRSNSYARCLLLGLAISCNIGGMMSPISSPQNAIALGILESNSPDHSITFIQWILVAVPFCIIAIVLSWLYLITVMLRDANDIPTSIPTIVYESQKFSSTHLTVMVTSLITITAWCSLSYTKPILGEMGTVAVIPLAILFGSGILTKSDLSNFSWNLILLVGGGSVLGSAVNSSRLLHLIAESIEPHLQHSTQYVQVISILLLVFVVTTFVSHTVAALILSPLIVEIGVDNGNVRSLCICATLMMSGTMSLPMSSFPNVNSLLIDDDFNRPFLRPVDYLKHGTPISTMLLILTATIAYALTLVVF